SDEPEDEVTVVWDVDAAGDADAALPDAARAGTGDDAEIYRPGGGKLEKPIPQGAPPATRLILLEFDDDTPGLPATESAPVVGADPGSRPAPAEPALESKAPAERAHASTAPARGEPAPPPPPRHRDDQGDGVSQAAECEPDPFDGFPVPDEEIVLESAPPLPQHGGSAPDELDTGSTRPSQDRPHARSDARSVRQSAHAAAPGIAGEPIFAPTPDKPSLMSKVTKLGSWIFGCAALVALLLWQGTRLYLNDLAQVASLRPALHNVCLVFACAVPERRAPKKIDLVGTSVATHPGIPGALRVNVNVINRADFSQGYPYVEVTLTDQNGRIVGRENYAPEQYQEFHITELAQVADLQPNVVQTLTLDLATPPNDAVGYEVQLLNR
ncbi:MAG: DUF3426 domain-containing protein, partial [Gammaproteobacteria bacterium]|nr:DUF3426 domain-containing protein [Gammaproteobacteria bacterium]